MDISRHITIFLTFILLAFSASGAFSLDAMPPGSLKAYAVAAENARYIERWAASAPEEMQNFQPTTRFAPGETAYTAVIVTGYSRNTDGQIDLEAGFRFFDDQGSLLFRRDAYARAGYFFAQETGFILLEPALDIAFDPKDAPGEYVLEFEVRDNINQRRTRADVTLTLDPSKYAKILKRRIDETLVLDDLWRYYDQSGDPEALERLVSVLSWSRSSNKKKRMLGEAAHWSLANRCRQKPNFRKQCQLLLNKIQIKNRVILQEILEDSSPQEKVAPG